MPMTGLTPEQRRLVEQAGDQPVRIEGPEMHEAYVLIRADLYERARGVLSRRRVTSFTFPKASENHKRRSSAICLNC